MILKAVDIKCESDWCSCLNLKLMPFLLQRLMLAPNIEPVTKVVCLTNVVSPDELMNDDDYEDILEDMRTECGKFG